MTVVVSTAAEADAERAVAIYNAKPGRHGPAVAEEIAKAYDWIGENPRLCSPFEYGPPGVELRVYHIRRFDLIVVFEVREFEAVVQSVVHANRPPDRWLSRTTDPSHPPGAPS